MLQGVCFHYSPKDPSHRTITTRKRSESQLGNHRWRFTVYLSSITASVIHRLGESRWLVLNAKNTQCRIAALNIYRYSNRHACSPYPNLPSRLMTILQVIFRSLCSVLTSVVVHHSHHGRPSKASENSVFGGIPFHPTARHSQRHRDTPCHEFINCPSGYVTSNNNTRRPYALIVKTCYMFVPTFKCSTDQKRCYRSYEQTHTNLVFVLVKNHLRFLSGTQRRDAVLCWII